MIWDSFESRNRKFVRRDKWVAKAKEDSTLYPWGGRKEQEWLEDMRTENVGVES